MILGDARAPDGLRLYAIGDVHGCDALLAQMHERIAADLAAGSPASHRIIHLGDYVDRGDESAGVLERLSRLSQADENVLCLRGNHEEMLLDFVADPLANGEIWLINGADGTLASYGAETFLEYVSESSLRQLCEQFVAKLPSHHRAFLESLPYSTRFGDYFFCHAGVRPGVSIEQQDPFDLTWIREGFLDSDADFGAVIVHGHTPVHEPDIRPNRIDIDTAAVLGGPLTCLVLEGRDYRFLQVK